MGRKPLADRKARNRSVTVSMNEHLEDSIRKALSLELAEGTWSEFVRNAVVKELRRLERKHRVSILEDGAD